MFSVLRFDVSCLTKVTARHVAYTELQALGNFGVLNVACVFISCTSWEDSWTLIFMTSTVFYLFHLLVASVQRKWPVTAFCRLWQLLKDTVLASSSRFLVLVMYVTLHYLPQLLKNPGSVSRGVVFSTKTWKFKHQGNSICILVFVSRFWCFTKIPWKAISDLNPLLLPNLSFLALILAGFVNKVQKKNIIKINVSLEVPR